MATDIRTNERVVNGVSSRGRQVLALVPGLEPGDIPVIYERLRALYSLTPTTTAPPGASEGGVTDWILCGIEEELRSRGLLDRRARLGDSPHYVKRKAASGRVMASLERACGGKLSARERAALGRVVGECLASYVERLGLTVCGRTMLQHAPDAEVAVDASFPGYAASGMLRLCLTSRD